MRGPDDELLLVDWLNALIYEMATRRMLFGRFDVTIEGSAADGNGVGRAGRPRAPPAGGRGQGRDLHGAFGRAARRRHMGRAVRRRRVSRARGQWRARLKADDGSCAADPALRLRVGVAAPRRDARARHHLRRRGADPRHGRQGATSRSPTSPRCPASSRPRTRCPTRTGATAFRSAASRRSIPTTAASSRPAASASTSPAACARCSPGSRARDIEPVKKALADALLRRIPAGRRQHRRARASTPPRWTRCSTGGARWAVERGYGSRDDLERIEEHGAMRGAEPARVSDARETPAARRDGHARLGQSLSRGAAGRRDLRSRRGRRLRPRRGRHRGQHPLRLARPRPPDRHRVPARDGDRGAGRRHRPARSRARLRADPLGAGRALSRRDARGDQLRARQPPDPHPPDARRRSAPCCPARSSRCSTTSRTTPARSRSTTSTARKRRLFVHRKGATRAFGPGHPDLPRGAAAAGQPVLIGGSMGTASYILAGTPESSDARLRSACHGAGRSMSRHEATRRWHGRQVVDELAARGILIRSPSLRGVAEEAPGAYKDVTAVVDAAEAAASRARWRGSSPSSASRVEGTRIREPRRARRSRSKDPCAVVLLGVFRVLRGARIFCSTLRRSLPQHALVVQVGQRARRIVARLQR